MSSNWASVSAAGAGPTANERKRLEGPAAPDHGKQGKPLSSRRRGRAAGPSGSLVLSRSPYLPGQNSTKFEMVNRATAKSLGLVIPPSVLNRANEMIE